MTQVIEVLDVHKTYAASMSVKTSVALDGISFSVAEGETFGFIGPNGAGKSTLIKILVGALLPTKGTVRLFGSPASEPEARLGLGFVPENPSLQEFLTPLEVLAMGLRLNRVQVDNERAHCLKWLEQFDLAHVADTRLRGFSKGMLQRTALAHALAINPRLLILDEPLSGLDPIGRKDVVDILDRYRNAGGTLFFSSHVLHDVERIADRFGLIHRGQLLALRSPEDVVADQAERYVLRFRSANAVDGAIALRSGLFSLEVDASVLSDSIARVQGKGGIVQEVVPASSLESVFFRTIRTSPGICMPKR